MPIAADVSVPVVRKATAGRSTRTRSIWHILAHDDPENSRALAALVMTTHEDHSGAARDNRQCQLVVRVCPTLANVGLMPIAPDTSAVVSCRLSGKEKQIPRSRKARPRDDKRCWGPAEQQIPRPPRRTRDDNPWVNVAARTNSRSLAALVMTTAG